MAKTANSRAERGPATGEQGPRWPEVTRLAGFSVRNYLRQVYAGSLHVRRDRLGALFSIGEHGDYAIFRETTGDDGTAGEPSVLVVGFRLRALGANRALHWLFQRVCLLTTPFWSGFPGFRVKLWMVNPATEDYLGIYRWAGADHATTYVVALAKVLRAVSTPHSVWWEVYPATDFEEFLATRAMTPPSSKRAAAPRESPA